MGNRSDSNLRLYAPIEYVEHVIPGTSLAGPQDEIIDIEVAVDALLTHYEFDDASDLGKDSKGGASATVTGVTVVDGVTGGDYVKLQFLPDVLERADPYSDTVPSLVGVTYSGGKFHADNANGLVITDYELDPNSAWSIEGVFLLAPTGTEHLIFSTSNQSYAHVNLQINTGALRIYASANKTSWTVNNLVILSTLESDREYHFAIEYNGTDELSVFIDGVLVATSAITYARTDDITYLNSLQYGTGNYSDTGTYVGNLRVTQKTRYEAQARTLLLFNSAGTNGSSDMTGLDVGAFKQAVTNSSVVHSTGQVVASGPTSLYFNGSAGLSFTTSIDIDTVDFSIALKVYASSIPGSGDSMLFMQDDGSGNGLGLALNTDGTLYLYVGTAFSMQNGTTGITLPAATWTDILITRRSNIFSVYKNGVSGFTFSSANDMNASGGSIYIGNNNSTEFFDGYMQDIHVVWGKAIYIANYTPLTTLPALVKDFTPPVTLPIPSAGEYGLAGKFGPVDKYMVVPAVGVRNNWTIALWAKADTAMNTGWRDLFNELGASRVTFGLLGGVMNMYDSSSITSSGPNIGTDLSWHHYAATCDGVNFKMYRDGTLTHSVARNVSMGTTAAFIGTYDSRIPTIENWDGPIDDIRIYSKCLTLEEIQQLYRPGLRVVSSQPITKYNFSDGLVTDTVDDRNGVIVGSVPYETDPLKVISPAVGPALKFTKDAANYVDLSMHNVVNLENKKFTFRLWVKAYAYEGVAPQHIFGDWDGTPSFVLYHFNGGFGLYLYNGVSVQAVNVSPSITYGAWYNIAVKYDGTNYYTYINGYQIGFTAFGYLASSSQVCIGRSSATAATSPFDGEVAGLEIYDVVLSREELFLKYLEDLPSIADVGTPAAHYDMTISAIQVPSPDVRLHLKMNDTGLSDSSATPKVVTKVGNTTLSTAQSVFNGNSAYFDGSGDELRVTNSVDLQFGNNDFIIQYHIYFNALGAYLWRHSASTKYSGPYVYPDGNIASFFELADGTLSRIQTTGGGYITTGQWYHIAEVRHNGTFYLYINGVSVGPQIGTYIPANNIACLNMTSVFTLGSNSTGGSYFNGYIDDFSIALNQTYPSGVTFTPPASQFSLTVPSTGIQDVSGNGNDVVDITGLVQVDGRKNFAGEITGKALSTNGTNPIYTGQSCGIVADQPFAVNFWIKVNSFGAQNTIVSSDTVVSNQALYVMMENNSNMYIYIGGLFFAITPGNHLFTKTGVWYNLCFSYDGSNLYSYNNGVLFNKSNASVTHPAAVNWVFGVKSHTQNIDKTNASYDEIRIYDTYIYPEEVLAIYYGKTSSGLPADFTKPVTVLGDNGEISIGGVAHTVKPDDTAVTLQAKLESNYNVGPGNITVTGTFPNFTITFVGKFSGRSLPLAVLDNNPYLGASTTVTQTQAGVEGESYILTLGDNDPSIITVVKEVSGQSFDISNDASIGLGRENGIIRVQKISSGDLTFDSLKVIEWRNQ